MVMTRTDERDDFIVAVEQLPGFHAVAEVETLFEHSHHRFEVAGPGLSAHCFVFVNVDDVVELRTHLHRRHEVCHRQVAYVVDITDVRHVALVRPKGARVVAIQAHVNDGRHFCFLAECKKGLGRHTAAQAAECGEVWWHR